MKVRVRLYIFALVLVMGLAFSSLAGVRGVAAQTPAGSLPQTKQPSSERFDLTGTVSVSTKGGTANATDQNSTINITGSGSGSGKDAQVDLTLTPSSAPPLGVPGNIGVSVVVVGPKTYLKLTGLGGQTDNKWYVTDTSQMQGGMMMPGVGGTNPGDLATIFGSALKITQVGKETLNGAATTKYQVDVDLNQLQSLSGGSTAGTVTGSQSLVVYLWIGDKDMYLHQVRVTLDSNTVDKEVSSSVAADLTIAFKDFDVPLTITAPANAEPIDLSSTGSSVLGGVPGLAVLGGTGMMPGMPVGTPNSAMPTGMPRTGAGDLSSTIALALALALLCLTSGVGVRKLARAR